MQTHIKNQHDAHINTTLRAITSVGAKDSVYFTQKKKTLLFLFYTTIFTKHPHQFIYYTHSFIKIIFLLTFFIISHLPPPNPSFSSEYTPFFFTPSLSLPLPLFLLLLLLILSFFFFFLRIFFLPLLRQPITLLFTLNTPPSSSHHPYLYLRLSFLSFFFFFFFFFGIFFLPLLRQPITSTPRPRLVLHRPIHDPNHGFTGWSTNQAPQASIYLFVGLSMWVCLCVGMFMCWFVCVDVFVYGCVCVHLRKKKMRRLR